MIQDEKYLMHYTAEEGKVIVPKDKTIEIQTKTIWIGSADSIDNYEEVDEIEEENAE